MEIGVSFPIFEFGADSGAIKAFAQAADELGYAHISCIDHVLGVDAGTHPGYNPIGKGMPAHFFLYNQFHEQFTLFAFMAAVTQRVRFQTSILILPQRQTALVAKQAAEVDILSKGRLTLGIAVGHTDIEYKGLGMDFPSRGARMTEQIEVLRLLWTQPVVHYKGKFHDMDGVGINPLPVQRPIPLWMGGWTEPVLRRAARLADGICSPMRPIDELKKMVVEAGRDPEKFAFTGGASLTRTSKMDDVLKSLATQKDRGITHVALSTQGQDYSVDEHIDAMRDFKAAYGPLN